MREDIFFANSKKQNLCNHSIAVAKVAIEIFRKLKFAEKTVIKDGFDNVESFEKSIFLAGIFHDIGKLDKNFQNFLHNKKKINEEYNEDGVHIEYKKEEDKFSFSQYPRHNEISWALMANIAPQDRLVLYAVYYHHAKIKRISNKEIVEWNAENILNRVLDKKIFFETAETFIEDVVSRKIDMPYGVEGYLSDFIRKLKEQKDSDYVIEIYPPNFLFGDIYKSNNYVEKKEVEDLKEIKKLLLRSLLVSADRVVSSLSVEQLDFSVEEDSWSWVSEKLLCNDYVDLPIHIENMLEEFKIKNEVNPIKLERDKSQKECAKNLAQKSSIPILFGPAGCGKTKIFLEWFKNKTAQTGNKKKLMIVAPRKIVCYSLLEELKNVYLKKSKIELITGDGRLYWDGVETKYSDKIEKSEDDVEVSITTIDQLLSAMLSHKNIDYLVDFLDSYVVFDEFHEFFNIPGIVVLFTLFVKMKLMMSDSKTLLVSATPNLYFVDEVLKIGSHKNLEYMDTFNKENFKFEIFSYGDVLDEKSLISESILFKNQNKGSIVIFNKAVDSQVSSLEIDNERTVNFHSKFTFEDKEIINKKVLKEWGKYEPNSEYVLRAGPIVQASLNISTMNLVTQISSAENICQRVGRANRFGSSSSEASVKIVLSDKTIKGIVNKDNPELNFLNSIDMSNQTVAFVNFLKEEWFKDGFSVTVINNLSELYSFYKKFHNQETTKKAYNEDFKKVILKSFEIFEKNDLTPYQYVNMKTKSVNKLSSKSLRGSSIYILPTIYDIYSKENRFKEWLYIPSESVDVKKTLTVSEDAIKGNTLINYQKELLRNTKISGFIDATYSKNYKSMSDMKVKMESKYKSSPLMVSYVDSVANSKQYNKDGFVYLLKGSLKIGLFEISLLKGEK